MPAPRGFSLSLHHLLILLTAAGLLPLALLGAWSIDAAADYRQREQERSMLDLARALSSAVDAELDGAVATLSSMARGPALQTGDVRAFYGVARAQALTQPEWLGVILTDADGRVLFRTSAPFGAPPGPIADPASLAQALAQRRPVVGRAVAGPGGRLAFPVRIPVFDAGGRTYTLNAVIRPDRLVRVLQRQRLPEGAVIAVLDGGGDLVARAGTVRFGIDPALHADLAQQGSAAGNRPREQAASGDTAGGKRQVSARTTMSRYGWTVALAAPATSLGAAQAGSVAVYGAGFALALALAMGVAVLLSNHVVRRVKRLQAETAALGLGKPVAPPASRIRELHEMGQALAAAGAQQAAYERIRSGLLDSLAQSLERQEEALAQAREANRARDEFLAVLGHELRNPLSPIVAALDLMDMRDAPADRRERAIMRRQVRHLKRLVDDLLDVSRITSGKLALDLHPVDLAEVVRDAVAALPARQVSVSSPDTLWVQGDESRLAQVINNLLSNAVRFSNDMRGEARRNGDHAAIAVSLESVDGHARLAVSDNGIGMPPALLARVFEPFYQAPQQMARPTGGLGLGLAIVRRLVELHGGQVSAHSAGPGQGSRFEVELPLGAPPEAPAPVPETGPAAARRVLVVDDNQDAAASLAALLESLGHAVRTAHDGAAALAACAGFAPEVAILDIGLPDMDGYALAAALREREDRAGMRLVALTGYGQKADVERAGEAGFDLHLTKPASVEELRRAVGEGTAAAI